VLLWQQIWLRPHPLHNQLINPIDGSVIQFDLLGMPRTRLGRRDLGAIQAQDVPAPLPLAGAFAAFSGSRRLRRRLRLSQSSAAAPVL
jgi:hypothetical protein